MQTFYWHDYETWGTRPSVDRPAQFAGVRTDLDLNIIGDPLVEYCQPIDDILPHPEAALVTGITPQVALSKGLPEPQFAQKILSEFSQPNTCVVGYNSLRFDDEVSRYLFFRNFFDPYAREWKNGNSRWDIIDMVRLVYAVRPDDIEWPIENGKPSFKLENLTEANGIAHQSAHDAFSDVEATIALAKLIKRKKPTLYEYVFAHRTRDKVSGLIDIANKKPLLHVSSKFPSERGCAGLVVPLAKHPKNKNAVVVYDLSRDPEPLAKLTAEEIHRRIFTREEELPEGEFRIPLKLVHLNKCPILATTKLLDTAAAKRLGINRHECESHWQKLRNMDVEFKLQDLYRLDEFYGSEDPETQLYDGFIHDRDKPVMQAVQSANNQELMDHSFIFEDKRLQAILPRYKARYFPQSLSNEERVGWREYVVEQITSKQNDRLNLAEYFARISELKEQPGIATKQQILSALEQYGEQLKREYQIS